MTQHNVTMPATCSKTIVFEQDRAQFTYRWKTTMSCRILMILPQ